MRIQFSVNDAEQKKLEEMATKACYPDVSSYCKDKILGKNTYAKLWNQITLKIQDMPAGKTFSLRDLIDTPPSNLGKKLFNNQRELNIEWLQEKDSLNANVFKKL